MPQLALDNALAPYFEKNFGFNITDAGNLAATFGMLSARPRLLSADSCPAWRMGGSGAVQTALCCLGPAVGLVLPRSFALA